MATLVERHVERNIDNIKWTWACRVLGHTALRLDTHPRPSPVPGDVGLFQVDELGHHRSIVTVDNRKLRIYPGDQIVAVFGNRYATDAYEAEVQDLTDVSLLTGGGMVGTVHSRHESVGNPTSLSCLGLLIDDAGRRVNTKVACFHPATPRDQARNLVVVIGTAMNTGKTTVASKLVRVLSARGLRVATFKLTGSVSNRDQDELRAAQARSVADFSDHGFPSTYLCSRDELVALFTTALADIEKVGADVTVMEIADGILQRETAMLIAEPTVHAAVSGVVLTADSAPAALFALDRLGRAGYRVIAVSGTITSAPLAAHEFERHSPVSVVSSADDGSRLGQTVAAFLGTG
jgi:hypothetical protein